MTVFQKGSGSPLPTDPLSDRICEAKVIHQSAQAQGLRSVLARSLYPNWCTLFGPSFANTKTSTNSVVLCEYIVSNAITKAKQTFSNV